MLGEREGTDKSAWKYEWFSSEAGGLVFDHLDRGNVDYGRCVSIGVNEFDGSGGRKRHNVKRARAFVVDVDAFLNKDELEQIRLQLDPSGIVITSKANEGYKCHIYFRIASLSNDEEVEILRAYDSINLGLAKKVDAIVGREVSDKGIGISKILRCAGFTHQKVEGRYFLVKWLDLGGEDVPGVVWVRSKGIEVRERFVGVCASGGSGGMGGMGYEGADEGGRHKALYDWVWKKSVGFLMPREWMMCIALGANMEANNPPLDEEEVRGIVKDVYDKIYANQEKSVREAISRGEFLALKDKFDIEGKEKKDIGEGGIIDSYNYTSSRYEHVLSDESIRARLKDAFGDEIIHSSACGVMTYNFKEGMWSEEVGIKRVWEMVTQVINNMKYEDCVCGSLGYKSDVVAKWVSNKLSTSNVSSLVDSIKKDINFHFNTEKLDSCPMLLNTPSGVVELETGIVRGHSSKNYFTCSTLGNVSTYDVEKQVDEWDYNNIVSKLVLEYCSGDIVRARFLQILFGMSLYGMVCEQKLPIFLGEGANGKSTLLELVCWSLGGFGATAPQNIIVKEKLGKQNQHYDKLAQLRNKRFVIVEDVEELAEYDESVVKNLTNGGKITARYLRQSNFEFEVKFTLFVQSNHLPIIRGSDFGIWRRILAVKFDNIIPKEKQVSNFKGRLQATPGFCDKLISWCVAGSVRYANEGLIVPDIIDSGNRNYKREMQPLAMFIEENFDLELDKKNAISIKELYDTWLVWCDIYEPKKTGLPFNIKSFGRVVKDIICRVFKTAYETHEFRTRDERKHPIRLKKDTTFYMLKQDADLDLTRIKKDLDGDEKIVTFKRKF